MQWKDRTSCWELSSAEHGLLAYLHLPNSWYANWRVYAINHTTVIHLDAALTLKEAKAVVQVLAASQL